MIVEFGRWRLVPVDSRNWELCHWHAASVGKNKGTRQWNRCGRFYSYNTIPEALLYAADVEMKAEGGDEVVSLAEALDRYDAIVGRLRADLLRWEV